ncbi:hypothetical protein ACJX0J_040483, partial [Zea mays]
FVSSQINLDLIEPLENNFLAGIKKKKEKSKLNSKLGDNGLVLWMKRKYRILLSPSISAVIDGIWSLFML